MPHRIWKHQCTGEKHFVRRGREQCDTCGAIGQYDCWGYSMVEAMGAHRTGKYAMSP